MRHNYLMLERPTKIPVPEFRSYLEDVPTPTIEAHWEVYNATRPIMGTKTWVDHNNLPGGWFWAVVDPEDRYADTWRRENEVNDAVEVHFVTEGFIRAKAEEYYHRKYDNHPKIKITQWGALTSCAIEELFPAFRKQMDYEREQANAGDKAVSSSS